MLSRWNEFKLSLPDEKQTVKIVEHKNILKNKAVFTTPFFLLRQFCGMYIAEIQLGASQQSRGVQNRKPKHGCTPHNRNSSTRIDSHVVGSVERIHTSVIWYE